MPILKVSQSSLTEEVEFGVLLILSDSSVISLKILSQLALENTKYSLGFCLAYAGIMLMSVK